MTKISDTGYESSSKNYIKDFSKKMLKTQIFIGTFQEKRYVSSLASYRDVVKIDSEEKEFIDNVVAVKKKLLLFKQELSKPLREDHMEDPIWVGITDSDTIGAPMGYNLWVDLPIEVFGRYWFKVKTVEFLQKEIRLKLEVVRSLKYEKAVSDLSEAEESKNLDISSLIQTSLNGAKISFIEFYKEYVTISNIRDSVIFIFLLIGTIIAGGANITKYVMEYLLKLMRETSAFIKVCTPIIISCINLIGKTIYGLYWLILALFHGKPSSPPQVQNAYFMVEPNGGSRNQNRYYSRGLPSTSSVKIMHLDD